MNLSFEAPTHGLSGYKYATNAENGCALSPGTGFDSMMRTLQEESETTDQTSTEDEPDSAPVAEETSDNSSDSEGDLPEEFVEIGADTQSELMPSLLSARAEPAAANGPAFLQEPVAEIPPIASFLGDPGEGYAQRNAMHPFAESALSKQPGEASDLVHRSPIRSNVELTGPHVSGAAREAEGAILAPETGVSGKTSDTTVVPIGTVTGTIPQAAQIEGIAAQLYPGQANGDVSAPQPEPDPADSNPVSSVSRTDSAQTVSFPQLMGVEIPEPSPSSDEFSGLLRAVSDVQATQTDAQARTPPAFVSPIARQVLQQMAEHAFQAGDRLEITLSPQELGRVRLSATQTEHGVVLVVQAERPETLDLMRRHLPDLMQDLQDMGFGDVSYSHGGQREQQQNQSAPKGMLTESTTDKLAQTVPESGLDLRL